jgi:hypothetical protein
MATTGWADIRQVVMATTDIEADGAEARRLFGLGPGFADPVLKEIGLLDDTMAVGERRYLELVAPDRDDHPVARWLAKVGGSAGYVLSTQVPSLAGVRERCAELGIRIVADTSVDGHTILQLHPKDMGVVLEMDEFLPKEGWFWDDLEGARLSRAHTGARIVDIRGVDIAAEDPVALAARWADLLRLEPPDPAGAPGAPGGGAVLDFSGMAVRFVPAGASGPGLARVYVEAADPAERGLEVMLCRTPFRLV